MSLTNEHVGPMILAKIKIYVFTRAELLFQVCYETPCNKLLAFIAKSEPNLSRFHAKVGHLPCNYGNNPLNNFRSPWKRIFKTTTYQEKWYRLRKENLVHFHAIDTRF